MACLTALRNSRKIAALYLCFGVHVFTADSSLTIYNQAFAVMHESVPLKLQAGSNAVRFTGATAHVEPESFILRDAAGKWKIGILEQNYCADVLSQDGLLNLFEGKTIEFLTGMSADGSPRIIRGKIVRSGYLAQSQARFHQDLPWFTSTATNEQPIIEVDGKLQFFLPGQPIFPDLGVDTILRTSLNWKIVSLVFRQFRCGIKLRDRRTDLGCRLQLDRSGIGGSLDMTGWVTIRNQSGKQFDNARIKLMAGDVSKIVTPDNRFKRTDGTHLGTGVLAGSPALGAQVTERTFDEYHFHSLPTPARLRDRETKQVQFTQASGIPS